MIEKWKKLKDYPNYMISNFGKIKSICYNRQKGIVKILKPGWSSRGYIRITIYNSEKVPKKLSIHRLVAQAFIPNSNNLPEVNHKNGIKSDNRANNLEWCTKSQNHIHAHVIGLKVSNLRGREIYRL